MGGICFFVRHIVQCEEHDGTNVGVVQPEDGIEGSIVNDSHVSIPPDEAMDL